MITLRILLALVSVVLSLNFLLTPIDATTEELNDTKNKSRDLLTGIFNSLFSETGEKFSNSKYGIEMEYPKNWTGIEMNVFPMALVSPMGFNFTEIFSMISNATMSSVDENIVSDDTTDLSEGKNQELAESLSNNLTQEFENMTSTMGIFIHDKNIARMFNTFNPNSTLPEDSLTSIFEHLMLESDPTNVCERNTLDRITINDNIDAEKSTQQCSFTDDGRKRDNLNYLILTPNAIVGIIYSSDSNNHNEKYQREFEESLKTLSVKDSLPINNQTIQEFLNDGTKNNTDSLLNETTQDFMNAFNGNELLLQGKYEEAIKLYDLRLGVDPDDLDALHNKGVALHYLGKYEEAINSYDKVLAIDPDYLNAVYGKGTALDSLGRHEEAISWYDRTLVMDPKNADALYGKGFSLSQLDRDEDAISWYDKAQEVDPERVDILTSKGITLGKLNRIEESITWFNKALEIDPKYIDALNNKAVSLAVLGNYDEAIVLVDKALGVDPENIRALTLKGSLLHDLGKKVEALTLIDKAFDIDPNNPLVISAKTHVQG